MKCNQRRPALLIPGRVQGQGHTNIEVVTGKEAELHGQKRCHWGQENDFTVHYSASASGCFSETAYDKALNSQVLTRTRAFPRTRDEAATSQARNSNLFRK